ncbi:MAG: deoxynucleoside kinase [Gammaproteobacteria bacterium]|nr:deoxynucleoside kinase [Gammaproteobacteria bacterium]MDD9799633.1 deoxynucleoside kinase [Gammaproteobacteria bacterium]MDD9815420.1 deoxynucleoside kinase [Gammaproteobacteria bacterium]MDD9850271.1 deoxynucleoside kinase [Gammaproteobacteria bacterium]MDD9871134.1 deoxynucleoside kinase [Gammaproteobacteria bacterium]
MRRAKTDIPSRIVVEGPIGVGKTTLASRLARSLDYEAVHERAGENPFLERFYRSRRRYALPLQLFFLVQRTEQLPRLQQENLFRAGSVADYMLEKDDLFARVNLDEDEYRLYRQVYAKLAVQMPPPDLVIYLQAPAEVLLQRIRGRGRGFEMDLGAEYLEQLVNAYTNFFHTYAAAPLLVINAAQINFADSDEDYKMLLEHIIRARPGRHFFNPMPFAGEQK